MVLQYQLAYVQRTLTAASLRKERLEDLMARRGAKKWDASKKAVMVRRLVTATQTVEQCVAAVDELTKKLEAVLATMGAPKVNNVAPFVKPAAGTEIPAQLFDAPAQMPEPAGLENPFGT
jgi:hypothetical protein